MNTAIVTFAVTGQQIPLRVVQGRPTSATFEVVLDTYNDGYAVEFSGTATVDNVDNALTANSSRTDPDPTLIRCATTGVVTGKRYQLVRAGFKEWVEVVAIESNGARVRSPLIDSYTALDGRLQSTELFASVPDLWAADSQHLSNTLSPLPDYRVRWSVVVGGTTIVLHTYLDLLRAPTSSGITLDDVCARLPGLRDKLPADYLRDQGRSMIDSAWRSVQADLSASDISSHAIHNTQILAEMAILKTKCQLAEGGWRPLGMELQLFYETSRDAYYRFFEMHFKNASKHALSANTTADAARRFVTPLAVR